MMPRRLYNLIMSSLDVIYLAGFVLYATKKTSETPPGRAFRSQTEDVYTGVIRPEISRLGALGTFFTIKWKNEIIDELVVHSTNSNCY